MLKHAVLALLLESLAKTPKPCVYMESHAGAGCYDLDSEQSRQTGEARCGIERLWTRRDAFPELVPYLRAIAARNRTGGYANYPGSPMIAAQLLRANDRLILMERHPGEVRQLKRALGGDPRVSIHHRDGLEGLRALLPPKPARGLVLVDPSYEQSADYAAVAEALIAAYRRWPTGVYVLWFPRLERQRDRATLLLNRIHQAIPNGLRLELTPPGPDRALGLRGSGLLILNLPWGLETPLTALIPRLTAALAE
ncbi:23S rRNA (adenine(2030)-N(6))-methyltransferase RlmJ [Thiocapsa imhoffii]|uniref:23S rRNA (adenine(2030)-N(6))-methyltransferase RlmJ n=1 Tax=Thiocapsa imhoffii TaxID=382777 RepID=UPI0030B87F91